MKRFTLDAEKVKKVFKNAVIFAAPALLVLLADLSKAMPDWFEGVWLIVALWLVNALTDLLRKFIAGK